jgi:hypothetical protein
MVKGDHGGCRDFRRGRASRRAALRAGALALTGLSLADLGRRRSTAQQGSGESSFGRARSCILIFQWGGPSQLETWDPKPDAPEPIRGEFSAIETRVPGVRIGEHFPLLSQRLDRLALVRSMSHDDPAHLSTAHRVLTGHLAPKENSDADGPSPRDWPHLGSLLAKVRGDRGPLPTAVTMPWVVAHPAAPGGRAPGQDAGWLGHAFDPLRIVGDPNDPGFRVGGLDLPEGVSPERLLRRRDLLDTQTAAACEARGWDRFQQGALDALASASARGAFHIDREDPRTRDRYGRHIHGQCLLLARRLVEAGVALVTVNWHDDGQNFWDTHANNFNQLKDRLMPPADRGFAALLDDLEARGLLGETLVVWVGEFGRAPKITRGNAGREHWPRCYTAALAGGGVRGGQVYGASDRWAACPARDPVTPEDLGATILHALGVDPATEIHDAIGRPQRINLGAHLNALFA